DNRPSADLAAADSHNAIDRAMSTWDDITCSDLGIFEVPYDGSDTGFIAAIFNPFVDEDLGGSFEYISDVMHGGWLQAAFFDLLTEEGDGSQFILGATFTIVFTDNNGDLIDLDKNGKFDVAWREVYYNDTFEWKDGSRFDVETIALHESGHGLSQAHFGTAFLSGGNEVLHFSPRAVMNAAYSGVQTSILQTDNAGHCSNWSSWPKN
ncbi:hypothetical protein, partial [uncultured Eudoraea sp.]